MASFSKKDLRVIEKYCGKDIILRYHGINNKKNENVVRIVNTGMVSSGKSSLYNVLIDSTEKERFPTGAARTTMIADSYGYKNIEFIDTPGIDVKDEDDALAFKTLMKSDIIIMTHNIKTGPLNRSEAEWLANIVSRMKDDEVRKDKLIFVCTWKDTREKENGYEDIINEVKKMVYDIVGTEIPFFDVSVKKYLSGAKTGKKVLMEKSGVLSLKQYLEEYSIQYLKKKEAIDKAELNELVNEMQKKLIKEKKQKVKQVEDIKGRIYKKYSTYKDVWKQVLNCFKAKRKQLTKLQNELNDI